MCHLHLQWQHLMCELRRLEITAPTLQRVCSITWCEKIVGVSGLKIKTFGTESKMKWLYRKANCSHLENLVPGSVPSRERERYFTLRFLHWNLVLSSEIGALPENLANIFFFCWSKLFQFHHLFTLTWDYLLKIQTRVVNIHKTYEENKLPETSSSRSSILSSKSSLATSRSAMFSSAVVTLSSMTGCR